MRIDNSKTFRNCGENRHAMWELLYPIKNGILNANMESPRQINKHVK